VTDHPFTVTLDPSTSGPTVLRVAGELDHHTAPALTEVLDTVPGGGLVIDLTDLAYCDSTGISVLVIAYQRAHATGSPFGLAGLSQELTRVFQVVGLYTVLPFHPTVDEAVNSQRS
jgi:anti-sigma B factor antagonist